MQARKKSSKFANFFLLPFSLCLVGGVVQVEVSEVALAQTTQDFKIEVFRLFHQGQQFYKDGNYQKAIDNLQKLLSIVRQMKATQIEPSLLLLIGSSYLQLGEIQKGREFLSQSLELARKFGDRDVEAKVVDIFGVIGQSSVSSHDLKLQASRLLFQGSQKYEISQFESALQLFQQSLAIYRQIKDKKGEVNALRSIGNAYLFLGKYDKVIEYQMQSLGIAKEIRDRYGEGTALGSLGIAYGSLDKYDKAIEFFLQSLEIAREIKNREGEGRVLGSLGITYNSLGKYDKAIEFHLQSLEIAREIKDRRGEGDALGNLGNTYRNLGKYDKAIEYQMQSLEIAREIKDRYGEGTALGNLGFAYRPLGKYDKVIDFYLQSLEIAREIKDRQGEGQSLGNLGNTYVSIGKYDKAIEYQMQSLEIAREIKDRRGEGYSLGNLGLAHLSIGKYDKAIDYLMKYLEITREIKDQKAEGSAFNGLGLTFKGLNQPELAILFYKQSVNITESIRQDIRKLEKDIQQSYLTTIESTYRDLADLLLQQNRIIEALQVLDLLKVQELEDYLKNIKGSDRSAQGVRLLAPESAISDKLLAISPDNSQDINNQLANQIQQLPKTEINKVPDYLNQIPKGTVLLYPFILGDRLEIILFAPNNLPIRRTVKISKDQLQELVTEFRAGLQNNGYTDVKIPAAKLYDLLIKPIEADLIQFKADTILYAPDGQLRYVPLAALYDGKQWLIEKYRISNLIAYTLTDFTANPKKQPSILAGAYGNGNYKAGETALPPLPATIKEVQAIANSFTNSVAFIEDKFSRQAIESQLKNYNILHLATHAEFNTGAPDNSFIIFGNGDKIRLNEIADWQIPNINLIILSACQTGLGKLGEGVEILGFGYQVQKAGAKNAIASLWKVDDAGTQALMDAFYAELKKGDVSIVEALRRAQIAMINSDKKGTGSDRAGIRIVGTVPNSSTLSHPYYWSAFFAIGNGL
ncbi:tetratricopeptide repeat protein [Pseudanabaena galeata UHCC 0370]|uniref:Tetratricopeptide repeat protein n=1 Tax=Pseudanabaena galeata UHCC 0370 TaxID=3110310 RepID=A0ABU5TER7_9CYAN|nr:tetratricopeptide repeat protein [Pseudanabaena galeata]MEA5476759.1 tetratricopeptide repeat protein [Pseudanabaena galeata UHCC 0370]